MLNNISLFRKRVIEREKRSLYIPALTINEYLEIFSKLESMRKAGEKLCYNKTQKHNYVRKKGKIIIEIILYYQQIIWSNQ